VVSKFILVSALAWSAAAVAASWLLPERLRPWAIAACGAGLLACVSPLSLALLTAGAALAFAVARLRTGRVQAIGAAVTLIVAAYVWLLWGGRKSPDPDLLSLVLPLGAAYYVLRLIHYLVETHKETLRPHGPGEYLAWLFLPSALPVGPIHRFDEFQRDWRRRRWDGALFGFGLTRILSGAAKLVLISNYLVALKLAPALQGAATLGPVAEVYATSLLFWINLYVQFSGYTDAAIGFAALAGFRLRENFDWPFLARNIGDFWRRWHMSLSSWCRDYVYAPVAAVTRSHLVAITAAMLTLGLWHAISLHYVLWGLYHALGLTVWRAFHVRADAAYQALPPPARFVWTAAATFLTLNFVMLSFPVTTAVERLILGG
jgi:alginate O-acetyltransferase complex protein AlgI